MRKQFIRDEPTEGYDHAGSMEQAQEIAPWAAEIVEVEGGYMAFESVADYETWNRQA
jgi:hypothetical protein